MEPRRFPVGRWQGRETPKGFFYAFHPRHDELTDDERSQGLEPVVTAWSQEELAEAVRRQEDLEARIARGEREGTVLSEMLAEAMRYVRG